MNHCFVIGGGRWGRIIALKFKQLGLSVNTVTEFPKETGDLTRKEMLQLYKQPGLIYIASKSTEHLMDFKRFSITGGPVWVEKSFLEISDELVDTFLIPGNGIFNQQLYNTCIDGYTKYINNRLSIQSTVERPVTNRVEMLDWLSHDLALIARIIWTKKKKDPQIVLSKVEYSGNELFLVFDVEGFVIDLRLWGSDLRYRTLQNEETVFLHSNWNGVLLTGTGSAETVREKMFDLEGHDLLLDSIRTALAIPAVEMQELSKILLQIQNLVFPRVVDAA